MNKSLTATAALLALSAQAQLSGPNRTAPGTWSSTFQIPNSTPSSIQQTIPSLTLSPLQPTTAESAAITVGPTLVNPRVSPVPRTTLGSPDATGGALGDSLRSRSAFPSSRDWETGVAAPIDLQARRLTPLPDDLSGPSTFKNSSAAVSGTGLIAPQSVGSVTPQSTGAINPRSTGVTIPQSTGAIVPQTTTAPRSQLTSGGGASTTPQPALPSDLNTSGINTPPRVSERPLDQALSAKIRAQLSQADPRVTHLSPETIRDMRITSEGGKVILEGNVASTADRSMVEVQARRVPGVVAVENRLNVRNTSIGAPATGQTGQAVQNPIDRPGGNAATTPEF